MAFFVVFCTDTKEVKRAGYCPDGFEALQTRGETEVAAIVSESVRVSEIYVDADNVVRRISNDESILPPEGT